MRAALGLARRGLGSCWPNPSVGCVVVQAGRVVGRAVTAPGGRPHAEPQALAMAGPRARGATVYVTLEPCAHHGDTPPCTDALLAAGIARVVVATRDRDERVRGRGIARLRDAGVAVEEGLLREAAEDVAAGFFCRVEHGRPLVTLKLASTLDGRIATRAGASRWITGAAARRETHALRGRHDAVMVGIGTALADDPELTCRLEGVRRTPLVRIVIDRARRLPPGARLLTTADQGPVWLLAAAGAERPTVPGLRVLPVPEAAGGLDLAAALHALGGQGLTSVLVEGGARLAAALLALDLVDRVVWHHAPAVLGGDGVAAVAPLGVDALADMPHFVRTDLRAAGPDGLSELRRAV